MIKLGNNDITLKVGSIDVSAAYLGSTLVYSGDTPTPPTPTFDGKWLATYTGGTTSSAQCDASSAITSGEIQTHSAVTSVEIGQCVTSISGSAFQSCIGLTSIDIPDSVENIGAHAFQACSALTSVTIPSGVTRIGTSAFRDCSSLTSITCLADTPPTLLRGAFDNTNDCPIYVPAASLTDYQNAWSSYASRIQAIP